MVLKRTRAATIIATILVVLAFLLGATVRALWIELEHHQRDHVDPGSIVAPLNDTPMSKTTPDPSRDLAGGLSDPA